MNDALQVKRPWWLRWLLALSSVWQPRRLVSPLDRCAECGHLCKWHRKLYDGCSICPCELRHEAWRREYDAAAVARTRADKNESEGAQFGMVHTFQHQSRDYVLGAEVGMFWRDCDRGGEVVGTYHVANEGELLRMARTKGLVRRQWDVVDDTWAYGRFSSPDFGGGGSL